MFLILKHRSNINNNAMKRIFLFTLIASIITSCNIEKKTISRLIQRGEFSQAVNMIEQKIEAENNLSEYELKSLQKQLHDIEAVTEEYTLSYDDVNEYLKSKIPDLSDVDMKKWENDYSLEYYLIDGKKQYYYNCVFDLFQVNENASKRANIKKNDKHDASKYPIETIQAFEKNSEFTKDINIAIRYFQDIRIMPNKSILKAWIPFVRENNYQSEPKIIHSNIKNFTLPSTRNLTSMIYFEHEIDKSFNSSSAWEEYFTNPYKDWIKSIKKLHFVNDTTFVFQFIYNYKSKGYYKNIEPENIKPYNSTNKEYSKYIKETVDNQFTPFLKIYLKKILEKN